MEIDDKIMKLQNEIKDLNHQEELDFAGFDSSSLQIKNKKDFYESENEQENEDNNERENEESRENTTTNYKNNKKTINSFENDSVFEEIEIHSYKKIEEGNNTNPSSKLYKRIGNTFCFLFTHETNPLVVIGPDCKKFYLTFFLYKSNFPQLFIS